MADFEWDQHTPVELRRRRGGGEWNEGKHPRDGEGQFARRGTGAASKLKSAAQKVGDEITGVGAVKRRGSKNPSTRQRQAARDGRKDQFRKGLAVAGAAYVGYQYGNAIFGGTQSANRGVRPRGHGQRNPMPPMSAVPHLKPPSGGNARFVAGASHVSDRAPGAKKPRSGRLGDGAAVRSAQKRGAKAQPRPFR